MTQSPAHIPESEALDINEQRFLGAKAKRTGARNYSPLLLFCSASLPVLLRGVPRHWRRVLLIHEADKRGVCACTVRPDSWHISTPHGCGPRVPWLLLISSRRENDLVFCRLLDVFTHRERALMTLSVRKRRAQQQRGGADVVTVTKVMMKWSAGPHIPALLWLYAHRC